VVPHPNKSGAIQDCVGPSIAASIESVTLGLARYIDGFYNPVRRHSALDHISPAQFERTASR